MGGNPAYSFIRDQDDGWPRSLQYRFPRFHSSLMADFVANRANGRFQYDDKTGQGKPQEKHWDVIKDMHPENGDQMMGDVIGIGWRPHKGREGQQDSRCLLCKTSETMMEYSYDLMSANPKGYDFSSPVVPMLKRFRRASTAISAMTRIPPSPASFCALDRIHDRRKRQGELLSEDRR